MTVKYFPFNSIVKNGVPDRPANAEMLAGYLAAVYKDGILKESATSLQVKASSGMEIQILYGSGLIKGKIIMNDSRVYLPLEIANATLKRIDRVVFRLDLINRLMEFKVLNGAPASNPVATALTRNDEVYEMCLADVLVGAGVTSITDANITDHRSDEYLCGYSYAYGLPAAVEEAMQGKVECIVQTNVTVAKTSFVADNTYATYPFKADIVVQGVTDDYISDIDFNVTEADSGIFAKVSKASANKVTIYANVVPERDFVIPTVECRKRVKV